MHAGTQPNGAVAEMLAAEHNERPFGVAGAMLPTPELQPTPPAVESWRPPPPDWQQEAQEAAERQQAEREQAEREAAAALHAQRLAEQIAAVDDPQPLPRRRGWMRTR